MLIKKISLCLLVFYVTTTITHAQIDSEIFLEGATVTGIAQDGDILWVAPSAAAPTPGSVWS